jgi:hypothetical protein
VDAPALRYERILAAATGDPDVVGVVVVGPRAVGRLLHAASDVDGFVITTGPFEPWRSRHGDPVELWPMTPEEFEIHGLTPESAWNRPAFLRARVDLDPSGSITAAVARKARLLSDEARSLVDTALDAYINSMYRSLRNLWAGRALAGRLDAAESIGPALTTIFALERRVRPFNKWLVDELEQAPLAFGDPTAAIEAIGRAARPEDQRALFLRVEAVARTAGHGGVVDGWEPDVAWLRGETR